MNKISNIKLKLGIKKFKPKLSSLIKVSSFIKDLIEGVNKLPNEQKKNYLEKFKKNIFMIDEFWYNDLSEEEKLQFHNVYIKF